MSSEFELPSRQGATQKSQPKLDVENILGAAEGTSMEKESPENANKEPAYSPEELLRVFDEIIFSGEYRETFNIRGKVPVTFRTRTAEEISEIQRYIDSAGSQLISTVESIRSIMNLQFSLCNYRGKDLSLMKKEERAAFIEKLPAPVVGMMLVILSKFDQKIAQACREGEENF